MDEYTVKITGIVEDCAQKTLYTTGKTVPGADGAG